MAGRQGQGSEPAVHSDANEPLGADRAGSPDRAGRLRFQVLGPVRAWRGDRPLPLGPPQQRAVLAMLLLHAGRPVAVPQLVDALWDERPPPRAVGTVRTYISRLRGLLEPERAPRQHAQLLLSSGGGYALRVPGEALDAARFEECLATARRLRRAGDTAGAYEQLRGVLALPEGVALAGLPGPYAQRQRDRLTELCVTAQEELFDCGLELGGQAGPPGDSIAGLRAFAAEHPLRERTQALVVLALHRAGRRAEALGVYAATRRTLDAELGTGPGAELRAVYGELREGGGSYGRAGPGTGRPGTGPGAGRGTGPGPGRASGPTPNAPQIAPPSPVPAQLPPDIADFTGRTAAVADLASALRGAAGGRAPVVATLSGLGGVGKTALALHVAHSVRACFPDGQLYVDLQGTGRAPADSGAVLTHFLRALGVAASAVPDGLEQKSALYRSLIADRRVLVLLDNARDSAQVRPLLPGAPGCAVLVTGRTRTLALPGAGRVDVEVLDEAEALALLGAIVGAERAAAEPEAARELVAVCGGLPLAVRIAAARLASRPGWTLADLVARLSERRRLDELRVGDLGVEATFRAGYEALGPGLAHAFRALALGSLPTFCRAAAAALLDTTDDAAEAAVEALVDAGLVEAHGEDRYRYHDLVGLFARRLGERHESPAERAAAQHRCFDHVRATVLTAARLIRPHGAPPDLLRRPGRPGRALADADAAREWLHTAHPRLYAAVERVLDATPGLLGPAVDLLTAWSYALGTTARHRALEPLIRRAVDRARRHGDDRAAARARRLLRAPRSGIGTSGIGAYGTGTYGRAVRALPESLRPVPEPLLSAKDAHELALVLAARGRERTGPPRRSAVSRRQPQRRCHRAQHPCTEALTWARRDCGEPGGGGRAGSARDRVVPGPGDSDRGPPRTVPGTSGAGTALRGRGGEWRTATGPPRGGRRGTLRCKEP
ncbi:BTAD domain-containing putative transcriptional regulator [Streptomyces sp. P9-2B-2]|uniref:AfsR/SARP family transcriptional regulator n=1 Tax=Streptomyces sp. P9-2B-2 TaxID=3057114 RepID=UPI0025B4BC1F|nr:BTAD domain-containing putative transcriptional regulator [Streptomyces sp. P9-2B-2]WJY37032.1 BTAD domain-containing putative transcriptional regulator [Streptomyces sp. P9-2B-2]